jgi:hypothetical protein
MSAQSPPWLYAVDGTRYKMKEACKKCGEKHVQGYYSERSGVHYYYCFSCGDDEPLDSLESSDE